MQELLMKRMMKMGKGVTMQDSIINWEMKNTKHNQD